MIYSEVDTLCGGLPTMPSPFPGMDPFLEHEKVWPSFQHHLVHTLYQTVLPGLVDRYRARVGNRLYRHEQILFTSIDYIEYHEAYLEIRQKTDNKLVTLLEVVSPANRTTAEGREAFLQKRAEARSAGASLVEIDLILQGEPMTNFSQENLVNWDFAVIVSRSTQPDRYEIYSAKLNKRLPRFRIPLSTDDRDTVLDLQVAFSKAYDQGDFARQINYRSAPPGRWTEEQASFIDHLLHAEKLR